MTPTIENEIHQMLYGDGIIPPQGHWVLFRWYKVGEHSKYWDENQKMAVGGPKWKYDEYATRVTYSLGQSGTGIRLPNPQSGIPRLMDFDQKVYLLEKCYRPKIGDHIFEFGCEYPDTPNEFIAFAATNAPSEKYVVKNLFPARVDNSRIAYYLALCELDNQRN